MKETIIDIKLSQEIDVQTQSQFEKESYENNYIKENYSNYDKNSCVVEYDYLSKTFSIKAFNFIKRFMYIFICLLIGWSIVTPYANAVVNKFYAQHNTSQKIENAYVPLELSDELFQKEYMVAGQAVEVYWTVMETGTLAKLTDIKTVQGTICPAKVSGMEIGDIITKINGFPLIEKEKWNQITSSAQITINAKRGDQQKEFLVKPAFCAETNSFKIGIEYYINKSYSETASTLSFVDVQTGKFASTAHIVEFTKDESEKSELEYVPVLAEGIVFSANVTGRQTEGIKTEPISRIGSVNSNNTYGVFGYIDIAFLGKSSSYKIAPASEIKRGEAYILSSVDGDVKQYPITIQEIDLKNQSAVEFTVDDEYLKSIGNLLHGMSGSPIIQNGKIIAAVARMNTQTMKCYGTLAEAMMTNLESVE